MMRGEILRHQPAERNPRHRGAGYPLARQQRRELGGKLADAIAPGRDRARPMAGKVIGDQGEIAFQPGAGQVPQPVIDPQAVQQHQRLAPAASVDFHPVYLKRPRHLFPRRQPPS